ncbi:MAG: DUF5706 domain-containing protein [Methanobrevibacter sp.]|uniref:Pycsar system effector family protein n=1 Tax=Methanobrevibacter sp. TaxID=66852 RepID=UPI002E771A4D|nr:Pycsar system effector family protein [Methanobrevibacter sp.]MEE0942221.1 DUF5706 domain-containing protein [Methanobrevibacter sp.]
MAKKEDYWKIYHLTESWIKFADTKAIAFLGIIGIILTIFIKNFKIFSELPITNTIKLLSLISVGLLIISVFFSILCLYPQKSDKIEKNAFYYNAISHNFKQDSYGKYLDELNEETFYNQLSVQIFQLASVCDKKYCYVEKSLKFFIWGGVVLFILLLCLYFNISFDLMGLLNFHFH